MNIEKIVKIFKMSQKELKAYVYEELCNEYECVYAGDGYVYAQGSFPVLLVAHMDTIHKNLPVQIYYEKETDTLSSPQGIGGDDRNGIYAILEIIKTHKCSVLFTEDEEVGGVGADKFISTKFSTTLSFNYMIEIDRKGNNDAVFYDCDNPEFEDFVTKEFFKTAYGSFSDISLLAPHIGCAAVNLSSGYYNAHTKDEFVVLSEIDTVIQEVKKLLDRTTEEDKFEYIEAERYPSYYNFGNRHNLFNDLITYIITYIDAYGKENIDAVYAESTEEAVGIFCMEHDKIPYSAVIDIEEQYY